MCGIVGIYTDRGDITEDTVIRMKKTLAHRGPDDTGFYISGDRKTALGHTRLSIIELSSKGSQPMSNDGRNIWVSFNGEIYNYSEIRDELVSLGMSFRSNSDTEVIVKSFEKWGINCLEKFVGMFAFSILDERTGSLYLVRDRIGVKPLYYYHHNNLLLFGSELRALINHEGFKKEVDYEAVSLFLKYGYIPCPRTVYKNCFKLEPGHYLVAGKNEIKKERYWDINDYYLDTKNNSDENDIMQELENLMISSFKYRLVSDVPVGMFLSGGIDSSLVTAILQKHGPGKLKTFTIGFHEQDRNEAENAKKIAEYLGTEHHEHYFSESEAAGLISRLPEIFDEPFGDNSALPTYLVSEYAVRNVKVALSADGGDELFGGYKRYLKLNSIFNSPHFLSNLYKGLENIDRYPYIKKLLGSKKEKLTRYFKLHGLKTAGDLYAAYDLLSSIWENAELSELMLNGGSADGFNNFGSGLNGETEKLDTLSKMMLSDSQTYLPDFILTKVDRCSMSVSLEAREPFLDHRLIEFVARLPIDVKIRSGTTKVLARRILGKYLPPELMNTRKQGFGISVNRWLRNPGFKEIIKEYLNPEKISREGIFNPKTVDKYLDEFYEYNISHGHRLWNLLVFQMWKERWL